MRIPRTTPTESSPAPALERWLTYLSVAIISLVAFEALAVATAMPYVVEDLNAEKWYALASGISLAAQLMTTALAGPWCDKKGPNQSLVTGLLLFVAGLIMATFAPSIFWLILGRGIQGLGGGLSIVPLYVLVGAHVPESRQPKVFAAFAAAWVVPALVGPGIAGLLVEHAHWRWVFGITPILIIAMVPILISTLRSFPDTKRKPTQQGVWGTAILAIFVGVAIGAVQVLSGQEKVSPMLVVGIVAASVAAFVLVRPLLPNRTLAARRGLPATVLLRGLLNGTFLGTEMLLPLMLKNVHGWSPTEAGVVLTVGSVTWAIGSWFQGRAVSPKVRRQAPMVGATIQTVGIALTILAANADVSGLVVLVGWLLAGLGTGYAYPAMTVHALALTPPERHGKTSSALQIADTMGAAICIAWAGIIYALTGGLGDQAFAVAIGFMALLMAFGVWVSFRVHPTTTQPSVSDGTEPSVVGN